ncbi:hypothetical protein KCH_47930 [Kitasatospora cheerisanensis KCTC 2395]|uniref:Uncharacterized protein n=1 Tax=Kitasatospora cheerisanensis KCTC 2395 TaxID=1348663 RepID=A0A066YYZ5_9ACTN|nr:hypothetical protein KCH_47930 [Kitasatospora cheerisanensis KCTC 2395]
MSDNRTLNCRSQFRRRAPKRTRCLRASCGRPPELAVLIADLTVHRYGQVNEPCTRLSGFDRLGRALSRVQELQSG